LEGSSWLEFGASHAVINTPLAPVYGGGFLLTAKQGVVFRHSKGLLICRTLGVAKDQCIWGFVLSGDLTNYTMDEQGRQNWSPRTMQKAAWPQE
jgi:hypothetical protein